MVKPEISIGRKKLCLDVLLPIDYDIFFPVSYYSIYHWFSSFREVSSMNFNGYHL